MKSKAGNAQSTPKKPIRGWFIVYIIVLTVLLLHGLELTVASIIIYINPSLAGLKTFVPLSALLFYVVTNVILILYTIGLYILIAKRKRSAILHNIIFNVLSVVFLFGWHFFGMKSVLGTFIDTLPSVMLLAYIVFSKRLRDMLDR